MFYRLPNPWNPDYVIPDYVMAEPPERGAYTTQWLPRGTISEVVPDYLAMPGKKLLGRPDASLGSLAGGCFSGSTLSGPTLRGNTLGGSSLGADEYTLQSMGDAGDPSVLANYGKLTAKGVIAQIRRLPPAARAPALKETMRRIDPTLQRRCEKYANAHRKAGVPAAKALELGLARAMSEGVTGELARLGKSRVQPHPSSLLGMGLDRARTRAQGADGSTYEAMGASPLASIATTTMTSTEPRKLKVQELTFLDREGASIRVTPTNGALTRARMDDISSRLVELTKGMNLVCQAPIVGPAGSGAHLLFCGGSQGLPPQSSLNRLFGSLYSSSIKINDNLTGQGSGMQFPVYHFTPPSGKEWGVYVENISASSSSPGFDLVLHRIQDFGVFGNIATAIKSLGVAAYDAVSSAVDFVAGMTCKLVSNPNAAAGAAAGNPAAGVGVVIAQKICGNTSPQTPIVGGGSSMLIPLLLVGGGLLAAIAYTNQD